MTVATGDRALALNLDVVLRCRIASAKEPANLTFAENYLSPYPAFPSEGFMYDLSMQVNEVVKGKYHGTELRISDAQTEADRKPRGNSLLAILSHSDPVFVAFDQSFLGMRSHYLVVRVDQPKPD